MSSVGFSALELRDIADLMDHMEHSAPIPRTDDGKRFPITVAMADAMDAPAVEIQILAKGTLAFFKEIS